MVNRPKQTVRQAKTFEMQNSFLLREIFCLYCTVVFALFVFFPFVFVLSTARLSCFSTFQKFAEPGKEGDRSNRGVLDG